MNGNYILKQADAHFAGNAADIVAGENIADFRVVLDHILDSHVAESVIEFHGAPPAFLMKPEYTEGAG